MRTKVEDADETSQRDWHRRPGDAVFSLRLSSSDADALAARRALTREWLQLPSR